MNPETLNILRCPVGFDPLQLVDQPSANGAAMQFLTNPERGLKYRIRDGIPIFVEREQITDLNSKYRNIYDHAAPLYDFISKVGLFVFGLSEEKIRKEFLGALEIKPGDKVLETSVGTGSNLRYLPRDANYYGLDLSWGMLKVCKRKLPKMGQRAELFLGEAESLPFADHSFDVVFQMGGINFFSDRAKAIREMVRVAKKGTRIIIMDETEKVARISEKIPGIKVWFKDRREPISAPLEMIPEGMEEVESRDLFNGQAWFISFRTPA